MKRVGWFVAVPLLATACTSDGGGSAPSTLAPSSGVASSAAAEAYVGQLNALCERLIPKVLAVRIGPAGSVPTMRQFLVERPQLAALYETFDAKVDSLAAEGAAQQVAEVFDDYRQWLAMWDKRFAAGAATGNPSKYNNVQDRFDRDFNAAPEVRALWAAGIECPAR